MVISSWRLQRRWRRLQRPVAMVLIAVGGFLLWVRSTTPPVTTPTVVAVADVAAGEVVDAADVTVVAWPTDSHPPPAAASTEAIVGRRATAAIRAGEPLTDQRVVGPSLLARAGPDAVAVALPADPLSGSGLVRAGDRVNLVGRTQTGTTRTLATAAPVLSVAEKTGAVVAVPAAAAADIVEAAATDAIAMVLAQA
ncbi:MAG: SAF domain-containing protein [Candidatus Nanopelagicales bacterium]